MKYYKNDVCEVFAYEEDGSQDEFIPYYLIPITEEEANTIRFPKKTKAQLKLAELQSLAKVFNENKNSLNVAWLAAAVADGVNEDTRKSAVLADIAELQNQYDADCASVRAKYA